VNARKDRMLSFNVYVALITALWFLSCSFSAASEIGDLRLIRVEAVSQSEIPDRDKYWPAGSITAPLFRVTFSTSVDLEKMAGDEHYNIDNITSMCRDTAIDKDRILRGFPSVLDASGRIDSFRQIGRSVGRNAVRQFEYHIYFDIKQSGIHGFYQYDLVHAPANICMTVNGAREQAFVISRRFASNTLVIPKQTIVQALAKAGQR